MTTVRDLMQTDVVTVAPEITVRELTRVLSEGGITGVPVVTDAGEVLGVVSATDVVRVAAEERETGLTLADWMPFGLQATDREDEDEEVGEDETLGAYFLPEDAPTLAPEWGSSPDEGPLDRLTVHDIMTPVTFSLSPEASMVELADFLVRGRIHRAVVVEDGRLLGIVTSMDVLRAMAEGRGEA